MTALQTWSTRAAALAAALITVSAHAADVRVTFTNNAPVDGTWLTPAWVGFHDGTFDAFDVGTVASSGIEALAEDGNPGPLSGLFAGSGLDGGVGSGPIAPGASASAVFSLATDGSNDYLSFAAMLLPSSDFFVANDDPLAISLASLLAGNTTAVTYTVLAVHDAGTEVNDFATSAGNGLVGIGGGQGAPGQGADQNGVVSLAQGSDYLLFLNLGGADVGPLDFGNYASIATVSVQPVPVPAALPLAASALAGLGWLRRRT